MKKICVLFALLLAVAHVQANIVINMNGAVLYGADTSSPLPAGTLLQIIVSRSANGFDAPTSGSFTGNSADDQVLASFVINNGQGVSGSYITVVTFSLGNGIDPGDQILLRWFPGLTIADATSGTAPLAGQRYGQFRTDIVQDLSDIAWVVPSDGFSGFLNFFTVSQGGSVPESAGVANLFVAAIPEPSTYALLIVGFAGVAFIRRRMKIA